MSCAILKHAMEVQRRRLIAEIVVSINDEAVTDRGLDGWEWPLLVDRDDPSLVAVIRISVYPADVEVVDAGICIHTTEQDAAGIPSKQLRRESRGSHHLTWFERVFTSETESTR